MLSKPIHELIIGIKGAGEMATAIAWRLYMANIRQIFMMEKAQPMAVRRMVSFCEAIYGEPQTVENVTAVRRDDPSTIPSAWKSGFIVVGVDPEWSLVEPMRPDVLIDAIIAKKNLGTLLKEASLVMALGPGFRANHDAHLVVETRRGHNLGRIIDSGAAEKNTGIPGDIAGFSHERVLWAPADGLFNTSFAITDRVRSNEVIGEVGGKEVIAAINGVIRGLIRSGIKVNKGTKLGDIDPRGKVEYCDIISDKARTVSGSVLEGILRNYNRPEVIDHSDSPR